MGLRVANAFGVRVESSLLSNYAIELLLGLALLELVVEDLGDRGVERDCMIFVELDMAHGQGAGESWAKLLDDLGV